jgi:hypothetical protein
MIRSSKNQEFRKAKFKLNHETLRVLGVQELTEVVGGISGGLNTAGPAGSADLACCSF